MSPPSGSTGSLPCSGSCLLSCSTRRTDSPLINHIPSGPLGRKETAAMLFWALLAASPTAMPGKEIP